VRSTARSDRQRPRFAPVLSEHCGGSTVNIDDRIERRLGYDVGAGVLVVTSTPSLRCRIPSRRSVGDQGSNGSSTCSSRPSPDRSRRAPTFTDRRAGNRRSSPRCFNGSHPTAAHAGRFRHRHERSSRRSPDSSTSTRGEHRRGSGSTTPRSTQSATTRPRTRDRHGRTGRVAARGRQHRPRPGRRSRPRERAGDAERDDHCRVAHGRQRPGRPGVSRPRSRRRSSGNRTRWLRLSRTVGTCSSNC